jgi:hypothetical protein
MPGIMFNAADHSPGKLRCASTIKMLMVFASAADADPSGSTGGVGIGPVGVGVMIGAAGIASVFLGRCRRVDPGRLSCSERSLGVRFGHGATL